jgi:predicted HicB family RNase H-like nuclease
MMNYKGYGARTEIDTESGLIFGEVVGLRDTITFQGHSVAEAVQAFRESVDLYLETCAARGLEPDRAYSGSIVVRTRPRTHRALVAWAQARGQSLNELVNRVLIRAVRRAGVEADRPTAPMKPRDGGSGAAAHSRPRGRSGGRKAQ